MCGNRELDQLEFHHPLKDRQYEAGLTTLSFKQIFEEMNKIILVCAHCHAIFDEDRWSGPDRPPQKLLGDVRNKEQ